MLAKAKLDSIPGLLFKFIKDAHILHYQYQIILKEVEHYRLLKEQIQNKVNRVEDTNTVEHREIILTNGREQEKQIFFRITSQHTSIALPVNVM